MKTLSMSAIAALMISASSVNAATISFDFGSLFQNSRTSTSTTVSSSPTIGGGSSFWASLTNLRSGGGGSSGGTSRGGIASLLMNLFGGGSSSGGSTSDVSALTCDSCGDDSNIVVVRQAPSEVPLPAAGFLLIGGIAGLGLMRRRKD